MQCQNCGRSYDQPLPNACLCGAPLTQPDETLPSGAPLVGPASSPSDWGAVTAPWPLTTDVPPPLVPIVADDASTWPTGAPAATPASSPRKPRRPSLALGVGAAVAALAMSLAVLLVLGHPGVITLNSSSAPASSSTARPTAPALPTATPRHSDDGQGDGGNR